MSFADFNDVIPQRQRHLFDLIHLHPNVVQLILVRLTYSLHPPLVLITDDRYHLLQVKAFPLLMYYHGWRYLLYLLCLLCLLYLLHLLRQNPSR